MIKVQEAEKQIIVAYEVYDQRPADSALLVLPIEQHQQRLGVVPARGDLERLFPGGIAGRLEAWYTEFAAPSSS